VIAAARDLGHTATGPGRSSRAMLWRLYALCALTGLLWCLLLYGPGTTVVHHGSLALPLFLRLTGALAIACVIGPRSAAVVVAAQGILEMSLLVTEPMHTATASLAG
jgi:hypothetical protein